MSAQKVLFVLPVLAMLLIMANAEGLKLGYYKCTCPDAEKIIQRVTEQYIKHVPSLAAGLLRMNFHDCIVRGCDASILLKPTTANNQTEITDLSNSTLRGFEIIDAIKRILEEKCPGTVSCTDILALAARDAIRTINGPWWEVPTGRRDGRVSLACEASANLPSPSFNITTLKQHFAAVGLSPMDLVVLSGAHTIGVGHCFVIFNRLYNFTGKGDTDPSLSAGYAAWLKKKCKPNPSDLQTFVFMDRINPKLFDEKYYTMVTQNRGLFESDAALLNDPETNNYIELQVKTQGSTFAKDFAKSMVKLNMIGVLTGTQGEIRKDCGFVN